MNIQEYLTQSQVTPDPNSALAELAMGCVREDEEVLVVMDLDEAPGCAACGSEAGLMPYRVRLGRQLVCGLLCSQCQWRMRLDSAKDAKLQRQVLQALRANVSEDTSFTMAFLFKHGDRVRLITGRQLTQEVLG